MKRVFLVMVVSVLLASFGFAQTPDPGSNADQISIQGCLGGFDGSYTVTENGSRQIFKLTGAIDLQAHVGHDVELTGHKTGGTVSSGAADNSFAVTQVNMISDHCAGAGAAAPAAMPYSESVIAPTATVAATSTTVSAPAAEPAAPAATSPSSATVSTPLAELAAPAATSTSSATVSAPAAEPLQPTRRSAHQRHSATKAAADAAPIATVNPSSDTVSPAVASPSSESDGTPAATAATPPVTHKGLSLSLLISFVVLVIVLGTLYPALSRWRKRKLLEQTGTPNLSFSNQTELAPDEPELRKVA
jgi:hypothetical protein